MSDILIKNIEMPTKVNHPLFVRISSDGHIAKGDFLKGGFIETEAKAIELPSHENLTEKSAFWNMLHEICVKCNDSGDIDRYPNRCILCKIKEAYEKVYQTPTILEASTKGEEK